MQDYWNGGGGTFRCSDLLNKETERLGGGGGVGGGYIDAHNIRYGLSKIYGKGWHSSRSAIKVTDLDLGSTILLLIVAG